MNAEAQSAIDNLINGNLTDAKDIAKDIPTMCIIENAENIGYSNHQALLIASYLKGLIDYEHYCFNSK
jgi:hypothetical protein